MNNEDANIIRILPDFVANQIAAGEVVQRPESVVKELVENSLDAGATSIAVIVKNAGKELIHIVDNGNGMSSEDLILSIKRHATSKIYNPVDLERILTYGFRGEALASIASVSQLEIRTRKKQHEIGWKLLSEPNTEGTIEPINTEIGTQVFVKNLFYNVPARRKFLRSNLSEFRSISDTMIKFALIRNDIRFTFYDGDTLIFDVYPSEPLKRIENVLGDSVSSSLMNIEYENELAKISGFIGKPQIARQTRTGQYLYLNRRSIQSKSLNYSVYSAFEHLLEKNKHPLFIINIEIEPDKVDINVHPQKNEVKFDDERYIYNTLHKSILHTLQKNGLAPEIQIKKIDSMEPFIKVKSTAQIGGDDFLIVNKTTGEIVEPLSQKEQYVFKNDSDHGSKSDAYNQGSRLFQTKLSSDIGTAFDAIFGKKGSDDSIEFKEEFHLVGDEAANFGSLWQLHDKYIFASISNGVLIIDQHAAHERILYERAVKAMNREFVNSQELLFPVKVNLSASQIVLLSELENELKNLGFIIEIRKNATVEIYSIPTDIKSGDEQRALLDIIDEYSENQKIRHSDKRDNLAASYACKAAIKSGQKLSEAEMRTLILELFKCQMPYVCPHGRPSVIEFALQDFDKQFKRI